MDASGLTHERKIQRIRSAEADFLNALGGGEMNEIAATEYSLALQSAIAIMRERGDAQYEYDVLPDGKGRGGFRLGDVPSAHIGIAADNAKYTISLAEFWTVDVARQRYLDSLHEDFQPVLPSLDEQAAIRASARAALVSLGISDL